MRELPILFSTPMVESIQKRIKNQTRRTAGLEKVNEDPDLWTCVCFERDINRKDEDDNTKYAIFKIYSDTWMMVKPRYQKGDHLWVKETFTIIPPNLLIFKADCNQDVIKNTKWKSSLFMRKEYARIWLECTGVRCERLKDITEEDARNEGVERNHEIPDRYIDYCPHLPFESSSVKYYIKGAVNSFISLWEKINGIESLKLNPWVFIYDFKILDR